jgi:hypothetical protein
VFMSTTLATVAMPFLCSHQRLAMNPPCRPHPAPAPALFRSHDA